MVRTMSRPGRSELSRRLDERIDHPERAESIDQALWDECGAERAILVMDMSGFTRITRRRGILHFLAVYRRAHRLVVPIIHNHAGRVVKGEADNVIAVFPRAVQAADAAAEMLRTAARANLGLGDDDQVRLCLAVGAGRILELKDDIFGDEVNVTFKLGEDVAAAGELLLTEGALQSMRQEGASPEVQQRQAQVGGVPLEFYSLKV